MNESTPFKPEHFAREDEAPDAVFYAEPRLTVHIDDRAIDAARRAYGELLPRGGAILDLMSSYRSHMPEELAWTRLTGLGLNETELRENDQLMERIVHDLNADPLIPCSDATFDGAVATVSVQYLTRPVEVFREVGRVLKPGAPFVLSYSNRLFPKKAVWIWRVLDDRQRGSLIAAYFRYANGFTEPRARDCTPLGDSDDAGDPLYAVWAHKR